MFLARQEQPMSVSVYLLLRRSILWLLKSDNQRRFHPQIEVTPPLIERSGSAPAISGAICQAVAAPPLPLLLSLGAMATTPPLLALGRAFVLLVSSGPCVWQCYRPSALGGIWVKEKFCRSACRLPMMATPSGVVFLLEGVIIFFPLFRPLLQASG